MFGNFPKDPSKNSAVGFDTELITQLYVLLSSDLTCFCHICLAKFENFMSNIFKRHLGICLDFTMCECKNNINI